jgi:hypothetical protein
MGALARQEGLRLRPSDVFRHQTIAELAAVVEEVAGSEVVVEPEEVWGDAGLTPVQASFFAEVPPDPNRFTMVQTLAVNEPVEPAALEQALVALARQHDGLRLRFHHDQAGVWHQRYAGTAESSVSLAVFRGSDPDRAGALAAAGHRAHARLDIGKGPLLAAEYGELDGEGAHLVLVAHHLVMDGVSWQILIEDLERAIRQVRAGEPIDLGRKTTSFQRWSERLGSIASEPEQLGASHWTARCAEPFSALPVDHERGENTIGTSQTITVALNAEETEKLLGEVPSSYRSATRCSPRWWSRSVAGRVWSGCG